MWRDQYSSIEVMDRIGQAIKGRLLATLISSILVGSLSLGTQAKEWEGADDQAIESTTDNMPRLSDLSLEELLRVKIFVPAAFTKLASPKTPASVTVITAEDIERTPARNIYDLIETYVPGAFWMNFAEGPVLAIRGNMASRAYKLLLRVNGRVMNNKGHYGAKSELEQWDLSDVSRIEVVRGSGSVIYGPGAVAGVINIITHDAKSAEGLRVTSQYVSKYDSAGGAASYGYQGEGYDLFTFASATWTQGTDARNFLGSNDNMPGYIGEEIKTDTRPLDYFGDYDDDPQIKVHIDTTFHEHWRFWARYTQQGSHWTGNEAKSKFNGKLLNQQGVRDRHLTTTLEYNNKIREDFSISAMLSADSSDVERRKDNLLIRSAQLVTGPDTRVS